MPEIFVFGSNLAGRHGKGAAWCALREHGAVYGVGKGPQGRSYAIPTKDAKLRVLELAQIAVYVREFCAYAAERADLTFRLTPIGCGLAGYKPPEIAPLFLYAPANVIIPGEFEPWLTKARSLVKT